MTVKNISIFIILYACLLISIPISTSAQSAEYIKLDIKGRVQFEIPGSWTIGNAERRERVQKFAEEITGDPAHMASFSARSYPNAMQVAIRVSFISMNPPCDQTDLRQGVLENIDQLLDGIENSFMEGMSNMQASMEKQGLRVVEQPSFAVESIGGQLAMVIHYRRTSPNHPNETTKVTIYNIPLGAESALITLSNIDGDQKAVADRDRLKDSFVIR